MVGRPCVRPLTVDPRLLAKPVECDGVRGAPWREWRLKFEGWMGGIDQRIPEAMQQAVNHGGPILAVPAEYRQVANFIYASSWGS